MSVKTGRDFQLNRYYFDGTTEYWYPLGIVNPCEPFVDVAELVQEVGTGTRKIQLLEPALVQPQINPTILVQRFAYLIEYAFRSGEVEVPAHTLKWTDGLTYYTLEGCKVNTCEVTIPFSGAIKAVLNIQAKSLDDTPFTPSWVSWTEEPITKRDVTALTLGGVDILGRFIEVVFRADNRVVSEGRGTGITPQDVYEQEARYSGRIDLALTSAALLKDVYSGTKKTVVITLQDRQTTPVTKTFTFSDVVIKSRERVEGLRRIIERVEWEGARLTIS